MSVKTPKEPQWAYDYFSAALNDLDRLEGVLELSGIGIEGIPAMPSLLQTLRKSPAEIRRAEELAARAQAEIDRQYSTLMGFGVQALWSWLETFIVDFAVLWIERRPSCLRTIKAPKVRVDIAEFALLRGRERARFIIDAIDRELGGPMRNGVGKAGVAVDARSVIKGVIVNARKGCGGGHMVLLWMGRRAPEMVRYPIVRPNWVHRFHRC